MTTIFAVVLASIALVSAMGKLRKMPQVIESMTHVGVKSNQIPLLAYLEILGALGLLIGIAYPVLALVSAGADPIVCAQSFPMSYKVETDASYSHSEKSGTAFVTEEFGSGELVLTALLSGAGDELLVDNIVCPATS